MTSERRSFERQRTTRRAFVGTVGAAVAGVLAGCFREDSGTPHSENETRSEKGEEDEGKRLDENEVGSVAAARSQLRATYERLARVPVAESGAFVFDTDLFVNEFEDGSSLSVSESPSRIFRERASGSEVSEEKAKRLAAAADLSVWLFNQRLLLFDTIASGRMFTRTYDEGYERPIEHLRNGLKKLRSAPKNRTRIHASLSYLRAGGIDIDSYDLDTVRPATGIADEIAAWTTPAYEGLLHTTRGRMLIETVDTPGRSDALFPHSKSDYERIAAEFRTAETSFNYAHGRGRRLEHVSDTFDYHRCVAAEMRSVFDDAVVGRAELEAGNGAEAERIASDVEDRLSRLVLRCS